MLASNPAQGLPGVSPDNVLIVFGDVALDLVQIAHGLAAAHEKGIVHRDLKPENLFVTRGGRVKILDFGLAKLRPKLDPDAARGEEATLSAGTDVGVVLGTAGYMSPEQVKGGSADHRADIFSFGAVLYEMLSGTRPFRRETTCLEKRPEERFQSARDIGFALEAVSGASAQALTPSACRAEKRTGNRLLSGAAVVVASGLGVGYYWILQRQTAPPLSFKQLTFRRGVVHSARFAPDGHTIVYGAGWEGSPSQVFSARLETPPHRLARVPFAGGAARDVAENVLGADWAPDGRSLAVSRIEYGGAATPGEATMDQWAKRKQRLEFPIGRVLYETASSGLSPPRVSPGGTRSLSSRTGRMATRSSSWTSRVERRRSGAVSYRADSHGPPMETRSGSRREGPSGRSASRASAGWSRGRRALPEGFHLFRYGSTVSPDGKLVAIAGPGQTLMLISIEGGEPRPVPGVARLEARVGWSADQRFL